MDPHRHEARQHSPQGTPIIQDNISTCCHSYAVAEACKSSRPAQHGQLEHSERTKVPEIRAYMVSASSRQEVRQPRIPGTAYACERAA